jgi:O-antigen/teichoic acid export membrane protein
MTFFDQHKDKIWVFSDQIIVSASAFVTNIILARALGPTNYGVFSSFVLIQMFLLSLSLAATTQISQIVYNKLPGGLQKKYISGLFYFIVLGVLVVLLTGHFVYIFFRNPLIEVTTIATAFLLIQDFLRRFFLTVNRNSRAFAMDISTNLIQLAILCYLWHSDLLNPVNAILVIGTTYIPTIFLGIYWLKPNAPSRSDMKYTMGIHAGKIRWLLLSAILQWLGGYFFILAAGWWIGSAALGALRLSQYHFAIHRKLFVA